MKNFLKLTKAFAVHALIISLMQSSFIFSAQAATAGSTEVTGKEILNVANMALNTYGQFLGQKQQMISQQIAATKNQALMQSLSPSCRKPDGTACYTTAGKFFPECPIPASMSSMPQNVCSAASPNPAAISSMITYESIAKGWVNYFEQMQNEASNSRTPFGMKCLNDKKKALDSQLTEMQNNLTRLQDQLNKDKETFKANNKKLLDDMTATNDELVGAANGSGKNNLKAKTTDFAKFFSQSCQSIIGDESLAAGAQQLGFVGIMQSMSSKSKKASDYNSNKTLIEADVRRDIEKNQKLIADGGLDDYLNSTVKGGGLQSTTKYGSVASAIVKQSDEFLTAKGRIAKELSKIGYTLPPMDKNFSVDFDEFLAGSATFFKKQYVNDCVTGADKSGTAISTDQILASLKQRSTNSEGTARDKYKAALKTILDSDAFIDDKLAQIKALETNYKDITITYQNSNAQRVTTTPYDLYMKTLAACESRFEQDGTFSTSASSAGVSQKKKVERGQNLLRELKSLNDNYASQLGSRVLEQALNCNGESKKSGSECISKDGASSAFDTANVNFCMSTASQCANDIQGCYAEADKQVQTRKNKLEVQAKNFNNNIATMVARSNAMYTAQKNAVMDMVKVVQARFPGTNFAIPADMFITMPEMKKDTYGVDIVNDGNLAFMDELPKKIDLLKKVFKDQQVAVDNEINDYIEKQSQAMEKEKGKWNALAGECKNMIDTSSKEIVKMNNENARKQGEMDNKVKNFCRKYQALSNHPVGGCENAKKLSGEMDDIASRIVPTVATNIAEFSGTCNQFSNESSTADAPSSCDAKNPSQNQIDACERDKARIAKADANSSGDNLSKSSKKKGGNITLDKLCSKGKATTNSELVEKILGTLPEAERKKFESKDDKEKLAKAFKSGSFEDVDGYDDLNEGGILEAFKDITGDTGNACEKLIAANTEKAADSTSSKAKSNSDYEAATKAVNEAKADAAKATDRNSMDIDSDNSAIERLEQVALKAKKAKDEVTVDGKEPTGGKKAKITEAIALLTKAGTVTPPSVAQQKSTELTRIGEQIDSNTICDSQAANTNVAKAFSGSLLPSGFDEARLGISK